MTDTPASVDRNPYTIAVELIWCNKKPRSRIMRTDIDLDSVGALVWKGKPAWKDETKPEPIVGTAKLPANRRFRLDRLRCTKGLPAGYGNTLYWYDWQEDEWFLAKGFDRDDVYALGVHVFWCTAKGRVRRLDVDMKQAFGLWWKHRKNQHGDPGHVPHNAIFYLDELECPEKPPSGDSCCYWNGSEWICPDDFE